MDACRPRSGAGGNTVSDQLEILKNSAITGFVIRVILLLVIFDLALIGGILIKWLGATP